MIFNPFPHIILPNAVSPELCRAAMAEWPGPDWIHWYRYDSGKLATKDASRLTPACTELMRDLVRLPIGDLTNRADTFPDLSLHGAGMHAIPPGCELDRHLDSDVHPVGWQRRFSAALFLDREWKREWGGGLQLWSGDHVATTIEPREGRVVIFEASDDAWHSVERISDDAPRSRNTLALFWWSQSEAQATRPRAVFDGTHVS